MCLKDVQGSCPLPFPVPWLPVNEMAQGGSAGGKRAPFRMSGAPWEREARRRSRGATHRVAESRGAGGATCFLPRTGSFR